MADSADSCEECEPRTSSESEVRENQVVSLLDSLRLPDSSDLSRKRKIIVYKGGRKGKQRRVSRSLIKNDRSQPRNDLKQIFLRIFGSFREFLLA